MANVTSKSGQFFGLYRVLEFIASGGFSEVWSAWDTRSNRIVALKIIPRSQNKDSETLLFGHEASLLARLNHPNIVPFYDYGQTPDAYYLAMRYIIGKSLAQVLEKDRLSLNTVLLLMTPMAQALDYVHEQNLVHRDFKPGNVLLDVDGMPYLTDFGLARSVSESTYQAHSTAGTLIYMPPEQFAGGDLTFRADQYSFGLVLYRLLCGQLPYDGKIAFGMRQINSGENLPDITALSPQLPSAVNLILWSLTAFEINARPAKLVDAMQSLKEILNPDERTLTLLSPATKGVKEEGKSRRAEIQTLLQNILPLWQQGEFSMSLTNFILLDVLIGDWLPQFDDSIRSLMLRGALEYDQQVEEWWQSCSDTARRRACLHALNAPDSAIWLRAFQKLALVEWASEIPPVALNNASARLMPVSDATVAILDVLTKALPARNEWQDDSSTIEVDAPLAALANSTSRLARQAASVIGSKRRLRAFEGLQQDLPRLIAFESAGTLPATVTFRERFFLTARLVFQQVVRDRNEAIRSYLWLALGSSAALGWLVYGAFRSTEFLATRRILNTLGDGLLFGILYAFSIWSSRHFAQQAKILPRWLRMTLAIMLGGLIFSVSATVFQQLVYDDTLDLQVGLLSGVLFVGGFVVSVDMPDWVQIVAGAFGVSAALLIPWSYYLNDGTRAPFIFDEMRPNSAVYMALSAAFLLGVIARGASGRSWLKTQIKSWRLKRNTHTAFKR